MTGREYEQFVRAVLIRRLNLSPDRLKPGRLKGVTFPDEPEFKHQIDLFFLQDNEVAEFLTIIECKYRNPDGEQTWVDRPDVARLAYVRTSVRASKAILVTNENFTRSAYVLARSERIALLIITPRLRIPGRPIKDTGDLFNEVSALIDETPNPYELQVLNKAAPHPLRGAPDPLAPLPSPPARGPGGPPEGALPVRPDPIVRKMLTGKEPFLYFADLKPRDDED